MATQEKKLPPTFGKLFGFMSIYIYHLHFICIVLVCICWMNCKTEALTTFSLGVSRPRVKNVYTPDMVLKYQGIPASVGELEYFFIIVAEIYTPGKFYFFLRENRTVIEKLTDDMRYHTFCKLISCHIFSYLRIQLWEFIFCCRSVFYRVNSNFTITLEEVYIGQVVAAEYSDSMWYRGRIVGFHQDQFEVFYFDYGSALLVDIDKIRHLHVHFTKLPIQAMRGRIFGICPRSGLASWPIESSKEFLNMVKGIIF